MRIIIIFIIILIPFEYLIADENKSNNLLAEKLYGKWNVNHLFSSSRLDGFKDKRLQSLSTYDWEKWKVMNFLSTGILEIAKINSENRTEVILSFWYIDATPWSDLYLSIVFKEGGERILGILFIDNDSICIVNNMPWIPHYDYYILNKIKAEKPAK
jgi:hypothetical protein